MKLLTCGRGLMVPMLAMAAFTCAAAERTQGGLEVTVRDEASAADAGLPKYPGAKPYKDADQSTSGANIGFSVAGFGLKVVATNLQSSDAPERVAAFYRRALSKYGRVLDCSDAEKNRRSARDEDDELACDANDPGSHSIVYKAGTASDERIVAIKPHGSGTRFSLVHVNKRGRAK